MTQQEIIEVREWAIAYALKEHPQWPLELAFERAGSIEQWVLRGYVGEEQEALDKPTVEELVAWRDAVLPYGISSPNQLGWLLHELNALDENALRSCLKLADVKIISHNRMKRA